MKLINIYGLQPLGGEISISGYKHSSVLLINAALLIAEGASTFTGIPEIKDTKILIDITRLLGGIVNVNNENISVDSRQLIYNNLPVELLNSIHGSSYLMPVLLTRFGVAPLFLPGGCKIGGRSVKNVIDILLGMGAEINYESNQLIASHGLIGSDIDLSDQYPLSSRSGSTKTALLIGALAKGQTRIKSPYLRQEVYDLIDFLSKAGAKIMHTGNNELIIDGVNTLRGVTYRTPGDFLEWVTYILAMVVSGGSNLRIKGVPPLSKFEAELNMLQKIGVDINLCKNGCDVSYSGIMNPGQIECPPIISDLQPLFAAALGKARGNSSIIDNEWPDRFAYIPELEKMGGYLELHNNHLIIHGPVYYRPTIVSGSDLRNSVCLLLAALSADGCTTLYGVEHLNRGYSDLVMKLKKIGAMIDERGIDVK